MAKVIPAEYLETISGRVSKRINDHGFVYRDTKFGNLLVASRFKVSGFKTTQVAAQTLFKNASDAVATLWANATQKATYTSQWKAQTKYKTLRGFMMASCIEQLQEED